MLNDTQEIWKDIKGFEGIYEASNTGKVRNSYGHVMKSYVINSGYDAMKLVNNGVRTSVLVHRVVLEAFVEQTEKEVNHIDGDKHNNNISNLEWISPRDNKLHAYATGLKEPSYNTLGKKHKSHVSKYHNVGYDNQRGKWNAAVRHKGKSYFQKRFETEDEAALHVNWILDELNLNDRPRNIVIQKPND